MNHIHDVSKSPVIADGMKIEWDVPIRMDDVALLYADIFRPITDGAYPVILSLGPYGKALSMQQGYPAAWQKLVEAFPDVDAPTLTVNDVYSWDPDMRVSLDDFSDFIGRNFKQPKEGLGFDGSPTAHMWGSMIWPNNAR
jgi:hypothetical protein